MSDDYKLSQIKRLNGYVNRLKDLRGSVRDLDFEKFEFAGTEKWSGNTKSKTFDVQYDDGLSKLGKVEPEIEEAIDACKSKMRSLYWSIDDPLKKLEAGWITETFF